LLYTKLEPATVLAQPFLTELFEKHDLSDAVFLVDRSYSLQDACHRHGFDFRYENHGKSNCCRTCLQRDITQNYQFLELFQQHRIRNHHLAQITQICTESACLNTAHELKNISLVQGAHSYKWTLIEIQSRQIIKPDANTVGPLRSNNPVGESLTAWLRHTCHPRYFTNGVMGRINPVS
jgi:hypothetical protein